MFERITEEIREHFTIRHFNLIVGAIFTVTSLAGTLLTKTLRLFESWPKFWMIALLLISVTTAALIIATIYRNNPFVQVGMYGMAVAPLALLVMSFVDRQFDNWTYEVAILEDGTRVMANATNLVYGGAIICTLALFFMTVWACLLPNWLRRPKTAGLLAFASYLCGIIFAIILFGTSFIRFWTVMFSLPPYVYVIFTWVYQTGGTITWRRACRVPLSTFSLIVDWAKSVNS